jgi:hypothetical protein
MKLERSNVEFPIWRKKVDKSLFQHNGTTIPELACRMWNISAIFEGVSSKRDPRATATALYQGQSYEAWVTAAHHGRGAPAFRFWYDPALSLELKRSFLMSYMRTLEGLLNKNHVVEQAIPFWEFLDLELVRIGGSFCLLATIPKPPAFLTCLQGL